MNKNNSKKKTRMKKFGVLLTLIFLCSIVIYAKAVSYTHLDVYKRQVKQP